MSELTRFDLQEQLDAATARAEQAEAGCAELMKALNDAGIDYAMPYKLHLGSRLLELAQIVEGLPRYYGFNEVGVSRDEGGPSWTVTIGGTVIYQAVRQADADALARLLKYRQEMK